MQSKAPSNRPKSAFRFAEGMTISVGVEHAEALGAAAGNPPPRRRYRLRTAGRTSPAPTPFRGISSSEFSVTLGLLSLRIERRHMSAVQLKRKIRNFPHAQLLQRIQAARAA